jgi:hypothetical protein
MNTVLMPVPLHVFLALTAFFKLAEMALRRRCTDRKTARSLPP